MLRDLAADRYGGAGLTGVRIRSTSVNARANAARMRCALRGGAQVVANALARGQLEPAAHVGPVLGGTRRVEPGLDVRVQGLGPLRGPEHGVDVAHLRDAHLLDARTAGRRRHDRRIECALGGRRERHEVHVGADPDDAALEPLLERCGHVPERDVGSRGIGGIPARDDFEQERCIGRRAGHRPRMVERAGERPDPGGADASVGRLEADGAAQRRGHADRPAGVAAEGERHLVRGERHGRAAARAARDAVERPRVVARAHELVDRGDPPRPLVGLRLADEDRAGGTGAPQRLGIGGRHVIGAHRRAIGRAHALRVEQVLDTQGHSGQRALRIAAAIRLLARVRLGPRSLEAERRERAQPAVDRGAAFGHLVDRIHGRGLAARVAREQVAGGEFEQSCHATRSSVAAWPAWSFTRPPRSRPCADRSRPRARRRRRGSPARRRSRACRSQAHLQAGALELLRAFPQPFLEADGVGLDAEARAVERRLRIEAVVDDGADELDVRLGLDEAPHDPERPGQCPVAQQHPGDDRVVRAAPRLDARPCARSRRRDSAGRRRCPARRCPRRSCRRGSG